jgi:hypothetical protein
LPGSFLLVIAQKIHYVQRGFFLPTVNRDFTLPDISAEDNFFTAEFFQPLRHFLRIGDCDTAGRDLARAALKSNPHILIAPNPTPEINL